jgi:cytoplasmic iron level regulating protein YaaA (DUF328/UPF0246 family)
MSLEAALEELASLKPAEKLCYTQVAKKHSVVRSTLTRRHQQILTTTTTKNINQ